MLSDSKTKKFRGVAFVELADRDSLAAALGLHKSRLGHKKINVELSAGGGGNGAVRRQKIQAKRDRLNQQAEAAEAKRGTKYCRAKFTASSSLNNNGFRHRSSSSNAGTPSS